MHAYFICSRDDCGNGLAGSVVARYSDGDERGERVGAVVCGVAADSRLNGQRYLLQLCLWDCCSNHSDSISWEEKYCHYLENNPAALL